MTDTPDYAQPALKQIDAFLARRRISEASLGHYAVRDAKAVARIREGGGTMRTAQRILDYIADQEAAAEATSSTETEPSAGSSVSTGEIDASRATGSCELKVA